MNDNNIIKPWYNQFWPWFLISIPLITVIAGISMIIISLDKPDSIVIDDYYKEGLAINLDLKRDRIAVDMQLSANIDIDPGLRTITIKLDSKIANHGQEIRILFSHPTQSAKDHTIKLTRTDKHTYNGEFIGPANGRWYVQLEPKSKQWRLKGELTLHDKGSYRLTPG